MAFCKGNQCICFCFVLCLLVFIYVNSVYFNEHYEWIVYQWIAAICPTNDTDECFKAHTQNQVSGLYWWCSSRLWWASAILHNLKADLQVEELTIQHRPFLRAQIIVLVNQLVKHTYCKVLTGELWIWVSGIYSETLCPTQLHLLALGVFWHLPLMKVTPFVYEHLAVEIFYFIQTLSLRLA